MEDIFRYIFIALIVISFLRSIFKKKKPGIGDKTGSGQGTAPDYRRPQDTTGYGSSSGPSSTGYGSTSGYSKTPQEPGYDRPEDDPRNYKYGKYVPPTQDQTVYRAPSGNTRNTPESGSDEYAMLRELENLFNKDKQTPTPAPIPPATRRTGEPTNIERARTLSETKQDPYEKTQNPHERTMEKAKMDTSLSIGEHTMREETMNTSLRQSDHEITPFRRVKKVSTEEEDLARKFAANLKRKEDNLSISTKDLRTRLNHPESLKDYVIISEILGKPKAFE